MSEQFLRSVISRLRTKLLDLSGRNSLISFKHSDKSRKQVRFVDASPGVVYRMLEDGGPLKINELPLPKSEPRDEQTSAFVSALERARQEDEEYLAAVEKLGDNPPLKPLLALEASLRDRVRKALGLKSIERGKVAPKDQQALELKIEPSFDLAVGEERRARKQRHPRELQTLLYPEEFERKLTAIYQQANLTEDETGLNTLYLAFGFLEWYDSADSAKPIYSPLVLYPVQLERKLEEGAYQFKLISREEDASSNICLVEKMRRDFQIDLPAFKEEDAPEDFYAAVAKVLKTRQPQWRVHNYLTLGFFSFAKLVMYQDLDPEVLGHISDDSLLASLIKGEESESVGFATDYDVDDEKLRGSLPDLVSSADSSQLSAVIDAMGGKHLVIEGPPGTGKSQTITNIIAAALAENKTVLFVAEKKAALEVVKKRLDDCLLGQFCLELYSNKTRKTEVLASFDSWMQDSRDAKNISHTQLDAAIADHQKIKDTISSYVAALNSNHGNLGKTLHSVVWRLIRLRKEFTDDLPNSIESLALIQPEGVSETQLDSNVSTLEALEHHYKLNIAKYGSVTKHPWYGLSRATLDQKEIKELLGSAERLSDHFSGLIRTLQESPVAPGWVGQVSLEELKPTLERVIVCSELLSIDIAAVLVRELKEAGIRQHLQKALADYDAARACEAGLSELVSVQQSLGQDLLPLCKQIEANGVGDVSVGGLPDVRATIALEVERWSEAATYVEGIAGQVGFTKELTVATARMLLDAAALATGLSSEAVKHRLEVTIAEESRPALLRLQKNIAAIQVERQHLSQYVQIDATYDIQKLEAAGDILISDSWFKFFKPDFWKARGLYAGLALSKKLPPSLEMGQRLKRLSAYWRLVNTFNGDAALHAPMGANFDGLNSDTTNALAANEWATATRQRLPRYHDIALHARKHLYTCPAEEFGALAETGRHPGVVGFMELFTQNSDAVQKRPLRAHIRTIADKVVALDAAQARCRELSVSPQVTLAGLVKLDRAIKELAKRDKAVRDNEVANKALRALSPIGADSRQIIGSSLQFAEKLSAADLPSATISELFKEDSRNKVESFVAWARTVRERVVSLDRELAAFARLAVVDEPTIPSVNLARLTLAEALERTQTALRQKATLEDFIDFLRTEVHARREGLALVLDAYVAEARSYKNLAAAYEVALLANLVAQAERNRPELRKSIGFHFDELRKRFRSRDEQIVSLNRKKLRFKLLDRYIVPGVEVGKASELTEMGLIKREIAKERKLRPIRELLNRAGCAIQQMKPCFMMSPLSVAQFIQSGGLTFDLVIMDEASQLRPEDSLGAITRANQPIIVGDPKQLPPTDFFTSSTDEDYSEDEAMEQADYESILDMARRAFPVARRLKWHYRSRHESLIAFSNQEFYDQDLVIFPSPNHTSESHGVKYVAVDGVYEKRGNVKEAQTVVEAAAQFMQEHPEMSLGIVAMNQAQRDLLGELLDERAKTDVVVETYRAKWAKTLEPMFVKNLENVQGDERDAIFISTVYGKDAAGNFYQRFGPINSSVGHRRLNVLFTRAKCQMRIFSSIDPDKIVADTKSSWGVRAFKEFLRYAKSGKLQYDRPKESGGMPDSDFEIHVMDRLKAHGYHVVPQVGVGGFSIDLAVKDPDDHNKFILGIECDGATYHSAKSARDRDKIRQEILENLGWKIHRIWSTDWFQFPDREVQRLIEKLPPVRLR